MLKHLATQHAIHIQECREFDTLLTSDASESISSGAIGTPSVKAEGYFKLLRLLN